MQKPLFIKIGFVLLLAVLINIPLRMMGNLVAERQGRQHQVSAEIAKSFASPQFIAGPILVLPYTEKYIMTDEKKEEKAHIRHDQLILMPRSLKAVGSIVADIKKRSLFEVPVYTLDSTWEGEFEIPAEFKATRHESSIQIKWGTPYISVAVNDQRGFASSPLLEMDGRPLSMEQGSGLDFAPNGVKALLDGVPLTKGKHPFRLALKLRGTEQLKVIPLAENLKMELSSHWPHPSFDGHFLPIPESQQIGKDGFRAHWEVSSLATNALTRLTQATAWSPTCRDADCLDAFEVRFINPTNIYQQSERALKYGFLFIGITFIAFFLFEILKRLAIHPAQYTLVGLAQAIFFLLLLSLSEHIDFKLAYVLAVISNVALIGYYLGYVMRGAWRGAGFASLLGTCYAALYGLLIAEDSALLMGSLLLFVLLAVAMIVTRKFDWYNITSISDRDSGGEGKI
jgi:inner membrane protein